MRHLKKTKKFRRTTEERKRLWQDLCSGLIQSSKIVTFTARAKWFRPRFERLVTLCKRAGDNKELAFKKIRPFLSEKDSRRLIEIIVPKLQERNGGYTALLHLDKEFNMNDKSVVMIVD